MARKKTPRKKTSRVTSLAAHTRAEEATLEALSSRISQVEGDVSALKSEMGTVREDLTALRTLIRQIDERTLRGERLLMEMQIDQRQASRLLEAIASKLEIPPPTILTPIPFAVPKPDAD